MKKIMIRAALSLIIFNIIMNCCVVPCFASEIGRLKHIEYNGVDYVEKTSLTPILILGIDQTDNSFKADKRSGGQSDFMLLLIVDHNGKAVHQLQIDRDTIMEIPTANVFGKRNGTRTTQVCLAHAFGGGDKQGCEFAAESVAKFLDEEISLYLSVNLNAIGTINDALGGVTVVIPDDFTNLDPSMEMGATLTLNAKQAEYLVRGRKQVGDGTNASRMKRQRVYMSAAGDTFKKRVKSDSSFFNHLLDLLEDDLVTNVSRGRLINELNRAICYDILPAETLAGEYIVGDDGFVEFHADEEFIRQWVFNTCFTPNNSH